MKKEILLFGGFLLMISGLSSSIPSELQPFHTASIPPQKNQTANEFSTYKQWTRVNTKPWKMAANIAVMCAPAPAQLKNDSPHHDKYLLVYVNEAGRQAMRSPSSPQFPPGSVIVKEKLRAPADAAPELLTAMVKRAAGFNPSSNDWEFFVLSGDANTVQAQGKLENCIACHSAQRHNDFVFRDYLPSADVTKQK
ncbi:MAG: cytochrome P460 family protein [Acidobacteria bacterium]|nr:cytochrome P460 family protein [Acidobacteriota bacterium]